MWKIRCFIGNVIRTIKWLPTIWNDRDYDYVYFFRLLEFKLTRMKKDAELINDPQSEKIEYALKLLRRINSNPYYEIAFMFEEDRWGKALYVNGNRYMEKAITDEDERLARIDFRKRCDRADYLEDQDIEFLFKYLTKHIRCWWT
jgi:hypothetical protein